jgi:uncharacterized protein YuzE
MSNILLDKPYISYDKDADAIYIKLKNNVPIAYTEELSTDVFVDYDENNNPVGIEIINFSKYFKNNNLISLIENALEKD